MTFRLIVITYDATEPGFTNIVGHLRFRSNIAAWEKKHDQKLSTQVIGTNRIEAYLEFENEIDFIDFKLRYL